MKLTLYSLQDIHAEAIKVFLTKNNLQFEEVIVDNNGKIAELKNVYQNRVSVLKITKSNSLSVINGFNEHALNQVLEHINKYNLNCKATK